MKTPEELNALKEEVETVSKKLHELTEEELAQVSGGEYIKDPYNPDTDYTYIKGLTDQYTGGGSYIEPGYPEDYYTGSH